MSREMREHVFLVDTVVADVDDQKIMDSVGNVTAPDSPPTTQICTH
jgi:hypothetical protein